MRYLWEKGNSEGEAVAGGDESVLAGVDFARYQSWRVNMITPSLVTAVVCLSAIRGRAFRRAVVPLPAPNGSTGASPSRRPSRTCDSVVTGRRVAE